MDRDGSIQGLIWAAKNENYLALLSFDFYTIHII